MSTTEQPRRLNAATILAMHHEERLAAASRVSAPEPKIELDYKKVAGAEPLTTWHLEVVPCFDDAEWRRMLDTATAAHVELLAKFNGGEAT